MHNTSHLFPVFRTFFEVIFKLPEYQDLDSKYLANSGVPLYIWGCLFVKRRIEVEVSRSFRSSKENYAALAYRKPNSLPFPESIVITPASENDLNVFKQNWNGISNRDFYGDKIYMDTEFFQGFKEHNNSNMLTPVKGVKGQPDTLKQRDKAANDLFSTAVSKIRQPIEALFSWLIEKTDIQRASKVRSTKGLMVHVFGRLVAAFIFLIFNS